MFRREFDVFLTALMFFTRIPVPKWMGYQYDAQYLQESSRYFPLMGWIVGAWSGAVFLLASLVLPLSLAVPLSIGASILLTGAFHEDGWADVCDGFGGGMTQMRVLDIMKDSRVGTYGSVALLMALSVKTIALMELAPHGNLLVFLVVAHALSRLAATTLIFTHEYVRANEDSKAKPLATHIGFGSLAMAALFGLAPFFLLSPVMLWALPVTVLITAWMARWFVRRIGGYTGDCLGAVQQVTEVGIYVTWVGVLS